MVHNVVQFGNILCMSFDSFGELHFRPTFDAGAVRRCISIVRAIQADCLANQTPTKSYQSDSGSFRYTRSRDCETSTRHALLGSGRY